MVDQGGQVSAPPTPGSPVEVNPVATTISPLRGTPEASSRRTKMLMEVLALLRAATNPSEVAELVADALGRS